MAFCNGVRSPMKQIEPHTRKFLTGHRHAIPDIDAGMARETSDSYILRLNVSTCWKFALIQEADMQVVIMAGNVRRHAAGHQIRIIEEDSGLRKFLAH